MESRRRADSAEEVSGLLSRLAEVHAEIGRVRVERRRLVEEVQSQRRGARSSVMRVDRHQKRLVVRRSRSEEDAKLPALAAALETQKAAHVQQLEDLGSALRDAAGDEERLVRDAEALEKRRAELGRELPRVYERAYGRLLAQGILDPIVVVTNGACACGCRLDPEHVLPTSCEDCDRLLIREGLSRREGTEPSR